MGPILVFFDHFHLYSHRLVFFLLASIIIGNIGVDKLSGDVKDIVQRGNFTNC